MFRAAFHTGYIPPKVLRLSLAQLDGASNDKRYNDDFFVDLIFEECDASMASKHLISETDEEGIEVNTKTSTSTSETKSENIHNEAASRRMMGTISGSENNGATVTATAYDSMLHRDSRFWDVIAERREENRKKIGADPSTPVVTASFYGPTIGRRREFPGEVAVKEEPTRVGSNNDLSSVAQNSINSFSIGGEFDFTGDKTSTDKQENDIKVEEIEETLPAQKDDLMEALMAIDDDAEGDVENIDDESEAVSEEIVFDSTSDVESNSAEEGNETIVLEKLDSNNQGESLGDIEGQERVVDGGSQSSKTSSVPSDLVEVETDNGVNSINDEDLLNSDSIEDVQNTGSFEFDDDDDDADIEDLENFLMKAKSP
jgi:hypothetical protein